MSLWTRIKHWFLDLFEMDAPAPQFSDADLSALREIVYAAPPGGWFAWECEQYAKSGGAFWFDHWRYQGSSLAYPEPTEDERRAVYLASFYRMVDQHGEHATLAHGDALAKAIEGTEREVTFARHPDPWAWAMGQSVH